MIEKASSTTIPKFHRRAGILARGAFMSGIMGQQLDMAWPLIYDINWHARCFYRVGHDSWIELFVATTEVGAIITDSVGSRGELCRMSDIDLARYTAGMINTIFEKVQALQDIPTLEELDDIITEVIR